MTKQTIEMPGILLMNRNQIYSTIAEAVADNFGVDSILTGIKCESQPSAFTKTSTYGIPLSELSQADVSSDLLDYAQNTVVIYAASKLKRTSNGDFQINGEPAQAILGFLRLGWA